MNRFNSHPYSPTMIYAMSDIDYDLLMTVTETAQELRLAVSSVHSMVSRGTFATVDTRFGKLITVESVNAYKAERLGKPGRKSG